MKRIIAGKKCFESLENTDSAADSKRVGRKRQISDDFSAKLCQITSVSAQTRVKSCGLYFSN